MLFLVYGVSRGARSVAGEEEAGTLELLLVTPLSSARLLIEEAIGLVTGVVLLGLALVLSTLAGSLAFHLDISIASALTGALAQVLLGVEFGCIALVAGALTGRRASAMEIAGGLAMAAYLLYVGGLFVGSLSGWRGLSPFDHVLRSGPLSTDLPVSFAYPMLVALAVVLVGLPLWARRDIGAGR
jgi:ABC-2 type transport system permease protein